MPRGVYLNLPFPRVLNLKPYPPHSLLTTVFPPPHRCMAKKKVSAKGDKKGKTKQASDPEEELILDPMSQYESYDITVEPVPQTSSGQSSFDRLMADDLESPASLRSVPNSRGPSPGGSMRTASPARSRAFSRDAGFEQSRTRTPSPVPMPPPRMSFMPSRDAKLGGYMKNRRDLLSIIKDLHSTGYVNLLVCRFSSLRL